MPWEMDWTVEGQGHAPAKKRSFSDDIAEFGLDLGKRAAGAVVSGVASIPLGIEKGVKSLVRSSVEASGDSMLPAGIYNPGIDTDESVHGQETTRDKDARLLAAERAASAVPNLPGARTLAKAGREGREAIHSTTSEATQRAVAGSQISGNIFKGEIDFGSDPSVRGYVMQAADVFGSMLPVIAGSLVTRRPGVGGAIGGGMAAGEGAESAAEFIAGRTDDQLLEESPFFARLVNGGASFEEARRLTADKASESAALLQGAVASVGDRFTGKLVTGKLDPVLARAAGNSVLGRAAAGGALSAAEEGLQEVGEGVASDIGVTSVVPSKEIGEDSAANLVLGALGGGPAGVGRGAYSGVRERIAGGRQGVADQTQAGEGGQAAEAAGGQDAPAAGSDAAAAPGVPDAGRAAAPVQASGVAADSTDEAERALRQPASLTALDRANELDAEVARIEQRMTEVTPENGYGPAFDAERADLAQQAEAARAERDAIASTWPAAVRGAPASFSTEAGVKLDGDYALMDADDLVTSHDENLRQNPVFPAELQPRDRTRSASELQVSGIVQRLDPARLGMSADAATGAPIIGADGLVESGNARTIALKRVYQANGQKAADYRAWLRESAQQFGITSESVDSMRKPVLVRVRNTPVNRAEFARQANQSTIQRMSPSEQAAADAKRLTNLDGLEPDDSGDFSASRDFIRQFMATLPITEQADMIESDGRLSTAGYRRIQNAILAKAYGESPTLRRMTESLDNNLANISKALTRAAPAIAAARERIQAGSLHDADIAPDIVQAVEGLSAIKDKGWTVAQELGQTDLTGPKYSPEAAELLQFLSDNIRSPRRIAEFLQRYHDALEAVGNPNQGSLLGDTEAPTRGQLIQQAQGTTDGNTAIAEPADQDRGQPDGARSRGEGAGRDEAGADIAVSGRQWSADGQAEWVMFSADSGTLGIPRAEMPQIKAEHRGALTQYLRGRGIEHGAEEDVDPASLKPTQAEFNPAKVEKAKGADGGRSILVSDDGHVLDGRHQWRAALEKGEPIKVIRFAAPMAELLPAALDFPSAVQVEGAEGAAEARLSRADDGAGQEDAGRISYDELKALADRLKAGMPNMPRVHVLADPSQAPKPLRAYIIRQDAWYDVEGAMHDGELYLFASGLADAERAEHVLIEHEAAHYGLRAVLGPSLKTAMRLVYMQNGKVRKAVTEMQKRGRLSDVAATEEVIVDVPTAELAKLRGWRRVVAMARDWLAERGYQTLAQKLTDWIDGSLTEQDRADLFVAELVRAARDYVAGKRPGRAGVARGTRLSGSIAEVIERQERWLEREAQARGYRDVEDLAARNYATFEKLAKLWQEKNPEDARLSRSSSRGPTGQQAPADRAEALIQQKAGGAAPVDLLFRAATKATRVDRLAAAIYDRAGDLLDRLVPEKVKAGVVADYGVPEAVIDQRTMLQGRQRVQLRKVGTLIDKLSTLTRAESRVAYEWMNMDGSDPKAYLSMMQGLPEESVKVLQDVQKMIDDLSQEAVRLGQLDKDAFERNRFAYLRRSYAKHITEQTRSEKAKRSRVISILGDQYKGRGLVQAEPMARMQAAAPDWWGRKLAGGKADTALKGQKFIRLEKRAQPGAASRAIAGMDPAGPGRIERVIYWPADRAITSEYADWTRADTWEVRDVKGSDVVLWRDFTKEEREQMGEVDEARFAIAKTLQGMIHDVETGRYLEWLARNYAKAEGQAIPGAVVEASERYRDTFAASEWVKVPDTKIPGTSVKKYGALAGHYLPGPIWNDLRQVVGGGFKPFGDTYAKILNLWKTSKTALSPAVHMNNVMSNFVMADWQDVRAAHVGKALRIILAASGKKGGIADAEAAREVLNRYKDSGGDIGSWVTQEIAKEQIDPLLADLEGELMATAGGAVDAQAGVYAALQHALGARFPAALEALRAGKTGKAAAKAGGALIDLYQAEDDVFRLAAWLKAKEEGADDLAAGKKARRSFLDYNINAPWVQAMRKSAWPFVSFTYRAVPLLAEIAGKKPHKLFKLMAFAGGLNALGVLMGGGGDDDERKLLPEEKAGGIWGMVPKLVRMPWNDAHGSPVYLDIRRWIPVGDVFDVGQGNAAVPMLPGLMPGGPLVIVGEIVLNKQSFTGKPITQETDTAAEKTGKLLDYLVKTFSPNLPIPNPIGYGIEAATGVQDAGQTYSWTGIAGSMTGRSDAFGREMSTAQAIASALGMKFGSYPADVLRRNLGAKAMAEASEIDRNISQLKRQFATGRISRDEFDRLAGVQAEKKRALMEGLRERLN